MGLQMKTMYIIPFWSFPVLDSIMLKFVESDTLLFPHRSLTGDSLSAFEMDTALTVQVTVELVTTAENVLPISLSSHT
jgi:hypothetical protein